jgi:hypothetical protein
MGNFDQQNTSPKSMGKSRSQSFRLCDVNFDIDGYGKYMLALDASLNDVNVNHYRWASLKFTHQKNVIKGEVIMRAATQHLELCCCKVLIPICAHLCTYNAEPTTTPLHTYYDTNSQKCAIDPQHITDGFHLAAEDHASIIGMSNSIPITHSICPGGSTTLLCQVPTFAHTTNFLAQAMLDASTYTFMPNDDDSPTSQFPSKHHNTSQMPLSAKTSTSHGAVPNEDSSPVTSWY